MVVREVDYEKVKKTLATLSSSSIFSEMFEHIKWNRSKAAYGKEDGFSNRFKELLLEVDEAKADLDAGNLEQFADEIGDSLWDLMFLLVLLEEKGISLESVLRGRIEKQVRRGPQIYEPQEEVTCAEELEIWNAAKKKEKSGELKGLGF